MSPLTFRGVPIWPSSEAMCVHLHFLSQRNLTLLTVQSTAVSRVAKGFLGLLIIAAAFTLGETHRSSRRQAKRLDTADNQLEQLSRGIREQKKRSERYRLPKSILWTRENENRQCRLL